MYVHNYINSVRETSFFRRYFTRKEDVFQNKVKPREIKDRGFNKNRMYKWKNQGERNSYQKEEIA